jgi:catechol 2,3-dioxygenase-like lactoylglutathione lyase family enzyme
VPILRASTAGSSAARGSRHEACSSRGHSTLCEEEPCESIDLHRRCRCRRDRPAFVFRPAVSATATPERGSVGPQEGLTGPRWPRVLVRDGSAAPAVGQRARARNLNTLNAGSTSVAMRAQPLIVCRNVGVSRRFYQRLLGCRSDHGGREYDRLYDPRLHHTHWGTDGLILQLHAWDEAHHHGHLGDAAKPVGNGMMLWFEVDDFDAVVVRARKLKARVVLDVHHNPNARHRELWLADPDGYTVVVASPDGEAPQVRPKAKQPARAGTIRKPKRRSPAA